MKRYIKQLSMGLLALCLGVLFSQCEDDDPMFPYGGYTPSDDTPSVYAPTVATNNVTNVTSSSANCGGYISSDGGTAVTARGVCWSTSQNPTTSNSHTSNGSGTGSFSSSITGLSSGTTYYVRAYATNSQGTSYGEQKSFTTSTSGGGTQSTWLTYDDGDFYTSWGFTNGGSYEWAVMFPSSMLGQYNNIRVSQVKAYFYEPGSYTLKIYKGNYSSTTSLLSSQSISVSAEGWKTISISSLSISNSQCLWVSLGKSCQSGEYPMCTAAGSNNPYARFVKSPSDNNWSDFGFSGNSQNEDITWMIRAYITYTNGKSGKMEEMELPLPQLPQTHVKNNSCPNMTVRKAM